MSQTSECQYCHQPQVFFDCAYPFWYHVGGTPRHGDWVPEHGCVADASKASSADRDMGCDGAR